MLRPLCLLAAVASVTGASAAPVPKKAPDVADLSGLHALISKRADKREWSEDDAATLKKTLQTLIDKVAEATGDPAWKPPVKLDAAKFEFAKGPVKITKPGFYLIDGDVTEVDADECVILATGVVDSGYFEDLVVVAKEIRVASAKNSLLVAAESVVGSGGIGQLKQREQDCIVVAGKRIKGFTVFGGVFHVITPEFSTDPKENPPVFASRVLEGAKLLTEPSDREVGDKRFKKVELKASIAK